MADQRTGGGGRNIFDDQTGTPSTTPTGFVLNPSPQGGRGAFGAVPGALGLPDPFGDLSKLYPGLGETNTAASADVLSKLRGELSPSTQAAIQDAAAKFGISSGMPGSGLMQNRLLRDIGLASEQEQESGLKDYATLAGNITNTQTVRPELQTQIAEQNALNAAAPNPAAAQSYAQNLFNKYLSSMRGGGGGSIILPGGGGGGGSGSNPFALPESSPGGSLFARGTGPEGGFNWLDSDGFDYQQL